ncbi:hypothetical protein SK128_025588 [Halocaridina rubra]|uniref:Retinol dehydrogenase 11 n=1 Tax=Halocaridina rubra TaxID=373956 RepID=A0AAN9AET7_HALRR
MWGWFASLLAVLLGAKYYYRATSGVCRSKRRLDGKTAIVTGSSAGIGKEAARDLAQRGARVILACRNVQKAQAVADDIIATTGNKQVIVRQVDTSDLTSVRKFAKGILDTEAALHILVNNAGILGPDEKKVSADGLELTVATNHFGHFLLTNMLLELLKSSEPSRIVNVSSKGHFACKKVDAKDLNFEKRAYPGSMQTYCHSKACNILFTLELADKLRNTRVTANCLHPGLVMTEIMSKEGSFLFRYLSWLLFLITSKDEKLGAQTIIYLAVDEDVENVSGKYFSDCKVAPTSQVVKDRTVALELWEASEQLVKLSSEDVHYKGKPTDDAQQKA